jgi:uncharacterized protein (DUF1778 family)
MSTKAQKQLTVRIDEEEDRYIRQKANDLGLTLREIVVEAITAYNTPTIVSRVDDLESRVKSLETWRRLVSCEVTRDMEKAGGR